MYTVYEWSGMRVQEALVKYDSLFSIEDVLEEKLPDLEINAVTGDVRRVCMQKKLSQIDLRKGRELDDYIAPPRETYVD